MRLLWPPWPEPPGAVRRTDIYVGGGDGILLPLPLPKNLWPDERPEALGDPVPIIYGSVSDGIPLPLHAILPKRSHQEEIRRLNRRWLYLEKKARKKMLRFNQELQQVRRLEEKYR